LNRLVSNKSLANIKEMFVVNQILIFLDVLTGGKKMEKIMTLESKDKVNVVLVMP